ncbi:MAG: hypothetical protein KA965_03100 [Butyrivibrio sp.]|nr:hypothetical protein [Butyrivibrio sp.]
MAWKKTWPGYIIWTVYTAYNILLVAMFSYFSGLFPLEYKIAFTAGFSALTLTGAAVISFLGGKLSDYYAERIKTGFWFRFFDVLAVILVFCGAAGIRLYILSQTHYQILGNAALYEAAEITAKGSAISQRNILTYLYESMLRAVLTFTGNTAGAAVVFQMILQLLFLLMLYMVIRMAMGCVPAFLVITAQCFMPLYLEQMGKLDIIPLFYLMFFTELLLMVLFFRKLQQKYSRLIWFIWCMLLGCIIGFMLYLDAGTIIILGFLFSAFLIKNTTVFSVFLKMLLIFAGTAAGFVLMLIQEAGSSNLQVTFENWVQSYFGNLNKIELFSVYTEHRMLYLLFGLVMFTGCIGFLRNRKEDHITPWMFMMLLITGITPFMGPTMMNGQRIVTLFYAVLAGGGIATMITPVKKENYKYLFEEEDRDNLREETEMKTVETDRTEKHSKTEDSAEKPMRYVPEGMVLPLGEEDTDEDIQPRMKMPDLNDVGQISLNRDGKISINRTEEKTADKPEKNIAEAEFDFPIKENDDFDL